MISLYLTYSVKHPEDFAECLKTHFSNDFLWDVRVIRGIDLGGNASSPSLRNGLAKMSTIAPSWSMAVARWVFVLWLSSGAMQLVNPSLYGTCTCFTSKGCRSTGERTLNMHDSEKRGRLGFTKLLLKVPMFHLQPDYLVDVGRWYFCSGLDLIGSYDCNCENGFYQRPLA